jgi:hypothetical protein
MSSRHPRTDPRRTTRHPSSPRSAMGRAPPRHLRPLRPAPRGTERAPWMSDASRRSTVGAKPSAPRASATRSPTATRPLGTSCTPSSAASRPRASMAPRASTSTDARCSSTSTASRSTVVSLSDGRPVSAAQLIRRFHDTIAGPRACGRGGASRARSARAELVVVVVPSKRPVDARFRMQHPLGVVVNQPSVWPDDDFAAPCGSVRRIPTDGRLTPCGN